MSRKLDALREEVTQRKLELEEAKEIARLEKELEQLNKEEDSTGMKVLKGGVNVLGKIGEGVVNVGAGLGKALIESDKN